MMEVVLNEEFILTCPDSFHIMDEAEKKALNVADEGQWIGLSDPDRHIIVTAGWKKGPVLALKILSSKDLAGNMEKQISKAMSGLGYRKEGTAERAPGGMKISGFCYEYEVQGTPMYAESSAMKTGKMIYNFHFYSRAALKEENIPVWEEMIGSFRKK